MMNETEGEWPALGEQEPEHLLEHIEGEIQKVKVREDNQDRFVKAAILEALGAAKLGNFGVGAVILNSEDEIVVSAGNRVFWPRFRSDQHAEMRAVSELERGLGEVEPGTIGSYKLVSTIEPCAMCFARLLIAGLRQVFFAESDGSGGMVQRLGDMPPRFVEYAEGGMYQEANCSEVLRTLAGRLYRLTCHEGFRRIDAR